MKQKVKDQIYLGLMYISSILACLVLGILICFITFNGLKVLNLDFIIKNPSNELYRYEPMINNFNKLISFRDSYDYNQEKVVILDKVDLTISKLYPKIKAGMIVERMVISNGEEEVIAGGIVDDDAISIENKLQQESTIIEISVKENTYGILGSIKTTLYLIILTIIIVVPLAVFGAIYLHEYAKKGIWKDFILRSINLLSGIPSIIFGLVAIKVIFPLTQVFNINTTSILLGALTLSIMVLPLVVTNTLESLNKVDLSLKQVSYALGANKWQTIYKLIIPEIFTGILNGVLLAISRIIGDSAALIYALGCVYVAKPNIFSQGTSLALQIYNIMSYENANYELACGIALVILVIMFILNISVKLLIKWYEDKRS